METRAPPAGYLRLDDAGYRRVGALPKNSRRGSSGLRLHHPDYGAREKPTIWTRWIPALTISSTNRSTETGSSRACVWQCAFLICIRACASPTPTSSVGLKTAELEKALQAKSEFLSRASHELRTPMNHILGFAQLLSLKKGLTEKQEASVRQILESGRSLLTLIDHLLGFSKSRANELSFEASGAPRAGNT